MVFWGGLERGDFQGASPGAGARPPQPGQSRALLTEARACLTRVPQQECVWLRASPALQSGSLNPNEEFGSMGMALIFGD